MGDAKQVTAVAKLTVLEDQQGSPLGESIPAQVQVSPVNVVGFGDQVINPPLPFGELLFHVAHSAHLRPPIDAYKVNVDGLGHDFKPMLPLDLERARDRVRQSMELDALADRGLQFDDEEIEDVDFDGLVTDEQVDAQLARIAARQRVERAALTRIFARLSLDIPFTELRRRTREDLESIGNAWWEILRDERGRIARIVYLAGSRMRLSRTDPKPTPVTRKVRASFTRLENVQVNMRLRRHVQLVTGTKRVYFKEFGDPRLVSAATGKAYESRALMEKDEPGAPVATEAMHFKIHSSLSPYGLPRWLGVVASVLGSEAADQTNLTYFSDKPPSGMLLVSDGRVDGEAEDRLNTLFHERTKGVSKHHRIVILQAELQDPKVLAENPDSGKIHIQWVPFTQTQRQDAHHLNYDTRNADKIGGSWRLPRILRGDARDFNRATAQTSVEMGEAQVFGPERAGFDEVMTDVLLPELGICTWRFESRGPNVLTTETAVSLVMLAVQRGVITPNEARSLLGERLGEELPQVDEPWARQPATSHRAGVPLPTWTEDDDPPPTEPEDPEEP